MTEPIDEHEQSAGEHASLVAPLWDARIAAEVVTRLPAPSDGATALVAECRTGTVIGALARHAPALARIMAVDPSREMLNLAREHAGEAGSVSVFYNSQGVQSLSFADGVFGCAVCVDAGSSVAALSNALAELDRVVIPGGHVAVAALGSRSFPVVHDLLSEVAIARGEDDVRFVIEDYLHTRVRPGDLQQALERAGLETVDAGAFDVPLGLGVNAALVGHPVLEALLVPTWKVMGLAEERRYRLLQEVGRRASVWWSGAEVPERIEILWAVARVRETEDLGIGEDDVVSEEPTEG